VNRVQTFAQSDQSLTSYKHLFPVTQIPDAELSQKLSKFAKDCEMRARMRVVSIAIIAKGVSGPHELTGRQFLPADSSLFTRRRSFPALNRVVIRGADRSIRKASPAPISL
jgi:hypothetical protein